MSDPTATLTSPDTLRHADMAALAAALNDQRTRSIDVVASAKNLGACLGAIQLTGCDPDVTEQGVTTVDGSYVPTPVGDEGIAAKLDIPIGYLRRCRASNIHLWDENVNGWLEHESHRGDSYLLRLLTHRDGPRPDGSAGVLRALLSNRYRCIDNFDILMAALQGLQDAGVTNPVVDADLTDRRMVVRVTVPEVKVMAEKLLADYRSPWTGKDLLPGWTPQTMADHNADLRRLGRVDPTDPVLFAGFVIDNSETGNGRFRITPRIVVNPCLNGLCITDEALAKVHVGGELSDGVITWSDETIRRNLALVSSQTRDAVATYLTPAYVKSKVEAMEAKAGLPVDDAPKVITAVSKKLGFNEQQAKSILDAFIGGGQRTCGGVMQAVTAAAQTQPDADVAWEMELAGLAALDAAAAAVRGTP